MNDVSSFISLRFLLLERRRENLFFNAPMLVRQKFRTVMPCCVCQSTAWYSYYGAIVCDSCKIFFRRQAKLRSPSEVCRWDKRCPINLQTRRRCSTCRFAKCLANGMQREMIRCSRTRKVFPQEKQSVTSTNRSDTSMKNREWTWIL